jgi:hypothetical protein
MTMAANKYEDPTQAYADANDGSRDMNRERSGQWWNQLQGGMNPQGFINQGNAYGRGAIQTAQNYNPNAAYQWLQSQDAGLQQNALNFGQRAFGLYDNSYQRLANQQSQAGIQGVADALAGTGLMNSGSGLAAMTDASTRPQLEYLNAITQASGNAALNQYNQQWQQAYGNRTAENQFAN